jgi:c-di-GMP-binding flagellar brake protein YcgR
MAERNERRKESRKKLMAFTPVYDQKKDILLGYIRDLTLQGALVIGEKPLAIDSKTTLSMELPGGLPSIKATHLTISARVARCVEDESPQNFKIGFEFIDVEAEQTEIIQALLERYRFHHKIK